MRQVFPDIEMQEALRFLEMGLLRIPKNLRCGAYARSTGQPCKAKAIHTAPVAVRTTAGLRSRPPVVRTSSRGRSDVGPNGVRRGASANWEAIRELSPQRSMKLWERP